MYMMKSTLKSVFLIVLISILGNITSNAQVGIGTVTPNASSILDVTSTTKGMLTPRMTTAQKAAIVTPTDGLIVYDTDLKSFYYYNSTTSLWVKISSEADGRLKYKLIKSTDVLATVLATELAAGGGTKYLLDSGTLYEINGTILLNSPIELNNSYLTGADSGEDKLIKSTGDMFTGATGGTVRILTLVASTGNVFNIDGASTANMIFRDCIVASSANVGLLKNFSLIFFLVPAVRYFNIQKYQHQQRIHNIRKRLMKVIFLNRDKAISLETITQTVNSKGEEEKLSKEIVEKTMKDLQRYAEK